MASEDWCRAQRAKLWPFLKAPPNVTSEGFDRQRALEALVGLGGYSGDWRIADVPYYVERLESILADQDLDACGPMNRAAESLGMAVDEATMMAALRELEQRAAYFRAMDLLRVIMGPPISGKIDKHDYHVLRAFRRAWEARLTERLRAARAEVRRLQKVIGAASTRR